MSDELPAPPDRHYPDLNVGRLDAPLPYPDLFTDIGEEVTLTHDLDRPVLEMRNPRYPGWCYPSQAGDCREELARCGGMKVGVVVNAPDTSERELYQALAQQLKTLRARYDLAFAFTRPKPDTYKGRSALSCWAFGLSSNPPARPKLQRTALLPCPNSTLLPKPSGSSITETASTPAPAPSTPPSSPGR